MSEFIFENMPIGIKVAILAKALRMEIATYNHLVTQKPLDMKVTDGEIAVAAYAYLHRNNQSPTPEEYKQAIIEGISRQAEFRNQSAVSEEEEKMKEKTITLSATYVMEWGMNECFGREAYLEIEINHFISTLEWIADICTGYVKSEEHPVTLFYPEIDREFDIDSFTSRVDLYVCMMRSKYEDLDEYLQGREDALALLGIPKTDARKIVSTLAPHVFKN